MEEWLRTEVIQNLIDKIIKEKERLIKERIKILIGIDINLEEEVQRTFPRIMRKVGNKSEHYFWNDGTVEGKILISFYETPVYIDHRKSPEEVTCGISYK